MLNDISIIKQKFSNAAKNYLANANIQRDSALEIISRFTKYHDGGIIFDLGSGVGTLKHQKKFNDNAILFDLSLNMLKQSGSNKCINGDANYLPVADSSIDMVISNLMIQWGSDKLLILNEINRILKPSSHVILTTLVKPSLIELQMAWQEVDNYQHTLNFDTVQYYEASVIQAGFKIIESTTWQNNLYFSDIYELMHHFKKTGTNTRQADNTKGLSGKEKVKNLAKAYEKQKCALGLPLSYQYLIIVAKKES